MKKIAVILLIILSGLISAQKNDILKSQNINEIEQFLKAAHPDDPRRMILNHKLATLKNSKWTEGAKTAKPMAARPMTTDMPNNPVMKPHSTEDEEFKILMAETSTAHTAKTVKFLNTLFDQDINRKEVIILVQNNSDCNLILRFQGEKDFYNVAVPTKGENTLVLNKGTYQLTSNVCNVIYNSKKSIGQNQMITLNQPIYKPYSIPSNSLARKSDK